MRTLGWHTSRFSFPMGDGTLHIPLREWDDINQRADNMSVIDSKFGRMARTSCLFCGTVAVQSYNPRFWVV